MTSAVQPVHLAPATPVVGIALALLSFAMFTGMDTTIKVLGGQYHVVQVVALNSLFGLGAVVAIAFARGRQARLRPRHWRLHLLRWSVSYLATLAIFWSYPLLPLADAYAILFASPLLVTALSTAVLRERVGWQRWVAVVVGFLGVLVILNPGHGVLAWPALATLAGAALHACNLLCIRRIGVVGEPVEATAMVGNALTVLVSLLLVPFIWVTPGAHDMALSMVAGTTAGCAFLLLATAFTLAPAALIAPFQYSQMVYGLVVGWLLFADLPSVRTLLGAAVIVGSGLYVLHREARDHRMSRHH